MSRRKSQLNLDQSTLTDGGFEEEADADKVAFDARKESGAVSFELASIHEPPKGPVEPRSVNFGFKENETGDLEEEDANRVDHFADPKKTFDTPL